MGSLKIFRTRTFSRWMLRAGLTDAALAGAVDEMSSGLVDADLGGYLLKKRVARPGLGKRAGARTIVATRRGDRWIFLYGFGKNERANIDPEELKAFRDVAKELLGFNEHQLTVALASGVLVEVSHDNEQSQESHPRRDA